jgi:hypothetical protein
MHIEKNKINKQKLKEINARDIGLAIANQLVVFSGQTRKLGEAIETNYSLS